MSDRKLWIDVAYIVWVSVVFILFEKSFERFIFNISPCLFIFRQSDKIDLSTDQLHFFGRMVSPCSSFGSDLLLGIEESKKHFSKVSDKR